jgi:quercetin dioxygenase-like cupin family protein
LSERGVVSLEELSLSSKSTGVIWTLREGEDLNANLVRIGTGGGVGGHVNDELDVLFVGVSGSGYVEIDGEEHTLAPGKLVFVPKGAERSTLAAPGGLAYLTVHRRRGPLRVGVRQGREPPAPRRT